MTTGSNYTWFYYIPLIYIYLIYKLPSVGINDFVFFHTYHITTKHPFSLDVGPHSSYLFVKKLSYFYTRKAYHSLRVGKNCNIWYPYTQVLQNYCLHVIPISEGNIHSRACSSKILNTLLYDSLSPGY